MKDHETGRILVVNEKNPKKLCGILTRTDPKRGEKPSTKSFLHRSLVNLYPRQKYHVATRLRPFLKPLMFASLAVSGTLSVIAFSTAFSFTMPVILVKAPNMMTLA